ncbi:MAG: hypothetical protein CVU95_03980 [Firmicutes bacterium HGW-Firmicutes-2]|jgi:hypothetical protein|nr:MAG: hypothetical protein CVU95_03980 [Firmicutes bacterium HGW-Firmicutes-2]
MTRGLITRIEDNFMIIMTDQMTIDKIKPRINVKVGQRIEYNKRDRYRGFLLFSYKKASSMMALILVLILTSIVAFGQNGAREIYAVVSVDINPSIELNLDQSGIVVGYKFFNEDGKKILNKSLLNQDLDSALSQVILRAQNKGYLVDRDMILISSTVLKTNDAKLDTTQDATIEEHIESYMITNKAKYQFVYIEGTERAQDSKPKLSLGRETLDIYVKDHKVLNLSTVETLVDAALPSADMDDENPIKIVLDDDSSTYDILTLTKPHITATMPSTNDILALAQRSMAFESGVQANINARSNHNSLFVEEIHSIKSLPHQASNSAQESTNKKSESEDIVAPSDKVNLTAHGNNNDKPPTKDNRASLDSNSSINASEKAQPKQEIDDSDNDKIKENDEVSSKTNEPQSTSENDQPALPSQANENAQKSKSDEPSSSLPSQASDNAQDSNPDDNGTSNSSSESDKPSSSLPSQASDKAQISKPDDDGSSNSSSNSDKPSNSPNPNSKKE